MSADKPAKGKYGYLFTVDILVEGYNNGIALETLLHILNNEKIKDYQVKTGIELGRVIANTIQEGKKKEPDRKPAVSVDPRIGQLERSKADNTLIRLSAAKTTGEKLSLPCRIINFDEGTQQATVYHVDEKKVYQFHLDEIVELESN